VKLILDPAVAVLAAPGRAPDLRDPGQALAAAAPGAPLAVALTDVELVPAAEVDDLALDESDAPALALDGDTLACTDRTVPEPARVTWRLARAALAPLGPAAAAARLTAYPVALRRGLEALGARPAGTWLCLERAGGAAWLGAWQGPRALLWRRLPAEADLAAEVARTLHSWGALAGAQIAALTTEAALAELLASEGLAPTLLAEPYPALRGLDEVPDEARFWLPETLERLSGERLARRQRWQRAGALLACLLAVGAATAVEVHRLAATSRVHAARARLARAQEDRQRAMIAHVDTLRRDANSAALRLWARALGTVSPGTPTACEVAAEQTDVRLTCTLGAWEAAAALGRALAGEAGPPEPVSHGNTLAWRVVARAALAR
jgi:hypothetical protein